MTLAPLLLAQLEALEEDLADIRPFAMVVLSEFGIVSGYEPEYASLRSDALDTLALCDRFFPQIALGWDAIPEASPNEHVNEGRLAQELGELVGCVQRARAGLKSLRGGAEWDAAQGDAEEQRWIAELLSRSGVKVERRASKGRPSGSGGGGGGRGPQNIFVCNRFSAELGEQIAEGLEIAGHRPVTTRYGGEQEALQKCAGGVFSLMPENAAELRWRAPEQSVIIPRSPALAKMRSKLLFIGREAGRVDVPSLLAGAPYFRLKNDLMDEVEFEQFASITSRPQWEARNFA